MPENQRSKETKTRDQVCSCRFYAHSCHVCEQSPFSVQGPGSAKTTRTHKCLRWTLQSLSFDPTGNTPAMSLRSSTSARNRVLCWRLQLLRALCWRLSAHPFNVASEGIAAATNACRCLCTWGSGCIFFLDQRTSEGRLQLIRCSD